MAIPGVKKIRFWDRQWPYELLATVPPVLAAVIAAAVNAKDPNKKWSAIWLGAGAVWLTVASVLKVLQSRRRESKREQLESPSDISGCVKVLYYLLKRKCQIEGGQEGERKLRITMHRVTEPDADGAASLEQIIPYVGGRGGEAGRKFPINCGVIGLAAQSNEPHTLKWDGKDPQKIHTEFVELWHFPPTEAEKMVKDRRSWMAVPIGGRHGKVVGVVYLDSCTEKFFTKDVQNFVLMACYGIADFIEERYG